MDDNTSVAIVVSIIIVSLASCSAIETVSNNHHDIEMKKLEITNP